MSSTQVRKQRVGDLSYGSTGVTVNLLSNIATTTVAMATLGFSNKIEAIVSVIVTSQSVAGGNPVEVIASLSGTSTVIGISVIQSTGTTVSLLVGTLGY